MGRGWKILIGVVIVLGVLLALNALATDSETKSAEVTVPGGRILSLPGGDLQVVEGGPRGGRPIVLIHCFTCAIDWWDGMRPALERKHRVIAIDLLGFGGSEKPDASYSIEEEADLVAQALSRLGVRDATVAGHSLGGTVAVALARQSPELVERLVIIDQAPNNDDYGDGLGLPAELTFIPVLGPALWRVTPDFAIKDGLGEAFAPGYDVPDEFVDDFHRMTYTSYDQAGEGEDDYVSEEPLDQRIRAAGIPLLAIFGSEDQIYDSPKALAAYAKVSGARTVLVPGAGHSPNVEKPAPTAALVLGFAPSNAPKAARPRHGVQEAVQKEKPVRQRP
jgi:pimeloyl-ACP methyl ester carboxylesterase